jgi:hypothetical protein
MLCAETLVWLEQPFLQLGWDAGPAIPNPNDEGPRSGTLRDTDTNRVQA